jgi:hypothetical protein
MKLVLTTLGVILGSNTGSTASAIGSRRTKKLIPWDYRRILPRGGAFFNNQDDVSNTNTNNNVTVEDYVTKMKEKDQETDDPESSEEAADASKASKDQAASETAPDNDDNDDDPAIVGVKSHGSSSKKSNAVGDPDGDDDDDDDDDTELSEFSEWEEIQDNSFEPQVQVQVELLGEEEESTNIPSSTNNRGGGGVGVKLGNRGRRKNKWRSNSSSSHDQARLLQAWMPHVYFPPTPDALAYLDTNARLLDAGSKSRLDRRTLYAALMLEWGGTTGTGTTGTATTTTTTKSSSSGTRKFLPSPTSQALQAALSMATQPQWRISSPGMNGIRLYAPEQETSGKGTTLAMQETVAMALVRKTNDWGLETVL